MSYKQKHEKLKVLKDGKKWEEKPVRPVVDCSVEPSLTVQADAETVDINKIMAKAARTGMLPLSRNGEPFYGDVSDLGGLADSIIKVREANELFMGLPAEVRERFDNDPVKLIEFLEDGNNRKEAEDLGIVAKQPVVVPAEPAPSPAPAGDGK